MNYFSLFAIPFDYHVSVDEISQTYRELQRSVHPDKFANASEHEQLLAVQRSAEVNDAYQTLKDPLRRAEYMLAELGVDIQIEQKTLRDPEFLMQQMQLREQLENLAELDDPEQAIEDFEKQVNQLETALYQHLPSLLAGNCKLKFENAADIVRKLKFVNKLRTELDRLEETIA